MMAGALPASESYEVKKTASWRFFLFANNPVPQYR